MSKVSKLPGELSRVLRVQGVGSAKCAHDVCHVILMLRIALQAGCSRKFTYIVLLSFLQLLVITWALFS